MMMIQMMAQERNRKRGSAACDSDVASDRERERRAVF